LVNVTVLVAPPVCEGTLLAGLVTLAKLQAHPVVAVGILSVPTEPAQAVPTFISKAAVPLAALIDGDVAQKPAEIVGGVRLSQSLVLS
jgi:hypothetical protein